MLMPGDGAQLLDHHPYARALTLEHARGPVGLAAKEHLAAVGRLSPGDDGGKSGLARAVLAYEPPDLTTAQFEGHVDQRLGRAEGLVDACQLYECLVVHSFTKHL